MRIQARMIEEAMSASNEEVAIVWLFSTIFYYFSLHFYTP